MYLVSPSVRIILFRHWLPPYNSQVKQVYFPVKQDVSTYLSATMLSWDENDKACNVAQQK